MRKYMAMAFLLMMILVPTTANAAVFTVHRTAEMGDRIYIKGQPDCYPLEYYDNKKAEYLGVVPKLLDDVSKKLGRDLIYLHDGENSEHTENKLKIDIVSCITEEEAKTSCVEYIPLISYEENEESVTVGLGFSKETDENLIQNIKQAVSMISENEKNSILLSYITQPKETDYRGYVVLIVLVVLLIFIGVLLWMQVKRMKNEAIANRLIDLETGLGNSRCFQYHFKYTLGDIARDLYYVAYIVIDSSYLRSYYINTSFDDVLKYAASVFNEQVEAGEVVARISDNGFAFAYQADNDETAMKRLTQLLEKLNGFENEKSGSRQLVFHGAFYHLNNHDKNCEVMLFNLRKNCNKILGTTQQLVYCDEQSMNKVQEEKKITEGILKGLEHQEFQMYLQFVVDNHTKQPVGAEALSRWESPSMGVVSPGRYIERMEASGLISTHDFYMFELACRQLEQWNDTPYGNLYISCNFTRITLSEETFFDKLQKITDKYHFDKEKLAIEITEDAMEKNREIATKNVKLCKQLGFRIYLDDLGSGYTSLANLCDYPVDVVKIDRDILLKTDSSRGKELFSGIIALAHNLKMEVVCEGVETEEQNKLVGASDCDYVQGYYYSKPLGKADWEPFLEKYQP